MGGGDGWLGGWRWALRLPRYRTGSMSISTKCGWEILVDLWRDSHLIIIFVSVLDTL